MHGKLFLKATRENNTKQEGSIQRFDRGYVIDWTPTQNQAKHSYFFCSSCLQVDDYSRRKGMSVEEIQRWLAPVLGYDSEA